MDWKLDICLKTHKIVVNYLRICLVKSTIFLERTLVFIPAPGKMMLDAKFSLKGLQKFWEIPFRIVQSLAARADNHILISMFSTFLMVLEINTKPDTAIVLRSQHVEHQCHWVQKNCVLM